MDPRYRCTVEQIATWAAQDSNVQGAIIIGSQVRDEQGADRWSDLDVMLFLNDQQPLLDDDAWLGRFGQVVCAFNYVTPLTYVKWDWIVKRALYDDAREVDLCILPYRELDDALAINQEIMAAGHRVLYDAQPGLLEGKLAQLFAADQVAWRWTPSERELANDFNDLLFHIVWAAQKARRGELWVAVSDINTHIAGLLLRLVEALNILTAGATSGLTYEGRFLEQRMDADLRAQLRDCFAKYDAADALATLGHLLDVAEGIAARLDGRIGLLPSAAQFAAVHKLYDAARA